MAASQEVAYRVYVMLELGIVLLSVVLFAILDLYVTGCEKV